MDKEIDKLNRKDEAKFLINYLTKRYEVKNKEDSFVLNVNAKWGYGKTFFLHLLEEKLKEKNHEVIFFDAWKNDFTKEPLLAFFSEINDSLSNYFKNSKNSEAKKIFKLTFAKSLPLFVSILTKHLTGLSAEEFGDLLTEDKDSQSDEEENSEIKKDTQNTLSSIMSKATEIALQEHKTLKNSIETFRNNMKLLIKEIEKENNIKLPLFILIDELDRCRPNYAIELLENIKHIFDIKGIYFIIATNSKQLSHSINAIYGANFSSEVYLKRFFDQEYSLKELDKYDYIKFLFDKEIKNSSILFNPLNQDTYKNKDLNCILIQVYSDYFELTLRDIEQSINMLSTIILTWVEDNEKIHIAYLFYFIICKQKSEELFNKEKELLTLNKDKIYKNINDNSMLILNRYIDDSMFNKRTKNVNHIPTDLVSWYKTIINSKDYNISDTKIIEFERIKNHFYSIQHQERYTLKNYPNLVNYAGQLK